MRRRSRFGAILLVSLGFAALILDAKTGIEGAQDGVRLCINTVLPSLFPFIFISIILNSYIVGTEMKIFRPMARFCLVPRGAETLFLMGILGGYPVGAQCIDTAYRNGAIEKTDAQRMLGFCNNAGPSFIFGIVGSLFTSPLVVWAIWLIHIFSAMVVGSLLPPATDDISKTTEHKPATLTQALDKSIRTICCICGWVILFRVLISFLDRWFIWMLPAILRIVVSGVMELTNGIHLLHQIPAEGVRFVLSSVFLCLGGVCVSLQTASVTTAVGTGMYFPGKVLQCLLSVLLSGAVQTLLFDPIDRWMLPWWVYVISLSSVLAFAILYKNKNSSSIQQINAV